MHLEVAQQHALRCAVEFHIEDRRMEFFLAQCVEERVVLDLDRLRGAVPAVKHAGTLPAWRRRRLALVPCASRLLATTFIFTLQFSSADRDQSRRTAFGKAMPPPALNARSMPLRAVAAKNRPALPAIFSNNRAKAGLHFRASLNKQRTHRVLTRNARNRFAQQCSA